MPHSDGVCKSCSLGYLHVKAPRTKEIKHDDETKLDVITGGSTDIQIWL